MKETIFFVVLALYGFVGQAQPSDTAHLRDTSRLKKIEKVFGTVDSIFERYRREKKLPSVSYGLVVDGALVHAGYLGEINREKDLKASKTSAYHIASMTKSITAMAVVRLRDEGKLRLDDSVTKYIPAAAAGKGLTEDAPPITVRDLLIHSAGFPEDNPWGDRQLGRSKEWLLGLFENGISFSTTPGTAYEYSNLGYAALGLIIESITGQTYQNYITENILRPLGMKHTYWDYADVPRDRLAIGYRLEEEKWVPQPLLHSGSFGAMGGLITTIEDFSRYMAFHLQAWPPRDGAETGPVKRSSIREMQHGWNFAKLWLEEKDETGTFCPILDFYGYGLHLYQNCRGRKTITHSGGLPGFGSQWRILPDYGIGLVAFANHTYAGMGSPISEALDSLLLQARLEPRVVPVSAVLDQRKEALIKLFPNWTGARASGIFADNFFGDYSLAILQRQTKQAFEKAGNIISVSPVQPINRLRGTFTMQGQKAEIRVSFTLSPEPEPKVQAFTITVDGG